MSGLCGWLGEAGGDARTTLDAMARRFVWQGEGARAEVLGHRFALAAVGPPGTVGLLAADPWTIAVQGHPRWLEGGPHAADPTAFCRRVRESLARGDDGFLAHAGGDFALAIADARAGALVLAVDRIGVRSLVHQNRGGTLIFGASADVVAAHPLAALEVAPQALYDYVYFHMVPGPATVYRDLARLAPGHRLDARAGSIATRSYWSVRFDPDPAADARELAPEFRAAVEAGVRALAEPHATGSFLSGGTDSSTVAGMLGRITGAPARTYSIGFAAAGFDELDYARLSARHFGSLHHEYYVTPDDVVAALPQIAAAYDQPFGNASAVPTYYCARMAHADGIARLLGGDGGDELFGGNARYVRQLALARYERVPGWVRRGLVEPVALAPMLRHAPGLRKIRSYVEQARMPMPARYESYNLLERLGPETVFTAEFLAGVDRAAPLARLQRAYATSAGASAIDRMLALDLGFTLADNDLPKVTRMCDLARVDVAFPLLDEGLVALSARLPASFKVRGGQLRWFFKRALADFLPRETLAKRKHGFGLPAGLWLRDHAPLRALAGDAFERMGRRGVVRRDFLADLMERRLADHAGYYGTMAWVLLMLELWYASRAQARPVR